MLKFKKTTYITINRSNERTVKPVGEGDLMNEPHIPEGMWKKCNACQSMIYTEDIMNGNYTCNKCGNYFRIDAKTRISMVTDKGSFIEWDTGIENSNPLDFKDYKEKINTLQERTNLDEAVITGEAMFHGEKAAIGVCDAGFLMGSMGYVTGEKITRMIEKATDKKLPVIIFACSGGARMQEGIVSLMQMAKTSAALKKHSDAKLLYITVLTDPTTGGVTASFAMLGDIIMAEPGALIGFAGPRVIEQTIGQKLPEGFQRAEFLVEHGFVDRIIRREETKDILAKLIKVHTSTPEVELNNIEHFDCEKLMEYTGTKYKKTAWEQVQIARMSDRPTALDYINEIFDVFEELHGDRLFGDDKAIVGGLGILNGMAVTVIGEQKGRNTKENIERNFGMPSPEGYRKALRLMKQAEKFKRPIINFVDTPGAFCGLEAEQRGQGEAIARNLMEMSGLKVPVLSIIIGEGGSGGALALALGNEVWIMENATYSILSPEGFASILWKDSKRADEAAEVMKITANDLKKLNIVERIIPEPDKLDCTTISKLNEYFKYHISQFLLKYHNFTEDEIIEERYHRFRNM
ncbi:acetyl-CoA carboxylase carboxyltransferase subunit alpha [Lachnotalea glycerini]|uniref:Multifunctional fusion protein n=1 Tax=Lachnotalea glycerini TaxID=1763509 RepID=A0A255IGL9_9FIRM|nr:acetyl-CoA carboxylase carboxyltransferase subunit alpha [Lachnotalea glycerini]PXV96225.1 acetyl-CoA carboxylase carboxyltransferase subunit alpha [Lachnotalea glycerini]RDY31086.1 acetyl-CoA carboxylase carboxyltransferase subunit beta [Lachnotalea glycerini]